jgi:hypothetical protein
MKGFDVHHIDGNHNNNDPKNLKLITPKKHSKIHKNEFTLWARKGSKLGNAAFIKRLKEKGPTKKELLYRKIRIEQCKKGLHKVPHNEETKTLISKQKKELFKDKTKHPLWGNTKYKITSTTGKVYMISGGYKQWCLNKGLNPSNLRGTALKQRKHCKGYKAEIIK